MTGQSGVGKSTLVNTLRGLKAASGGAAAVSPTQMTGVRSPYEAGGYPSPENSRVVWHDLPGCGTERIPCGASYYRDYELDRFDAFILVRTRSPLHTPLHFLLFFICGFEVSKWRML